MVCWLRTPFFRDSLYSVLVTSPLFHGLMVQCIGCVPFLSQTHFTVYWLRIPFFIVSFRGFRECIGYIFPFSQTYFTADWLPTPLFHGLILQLTSYLPPFFTESFYNVLVT